MKIKNYASIAAILLLIAPMVAGADEPTTTETLPCPADHAETTTNTETTTALTVENPPQATVTTAETVSAATTTTETSPPTTETPTTNTTPPRSYPAGAVIITELYPAPPTGAAEWVELWNATNVTIDLAGFALTDASGARTTLEGSMAPGDYFLISNPKGKLNNDGDTIALFDPTNTQLDVASYTNGIDRTKSWARSGVTWFVTTTPTPLGPNIISGASAAPPSATTTTGTTVATTTATQDPPPTAQGAQEEPQATTPPPDPTPVTIVATAAPEAIHLEDAQESGVAPESPETKTTTSKKSKPKTETVQAVALADVKNLKTGAIVRTQGIVSVPLGIFGASTFYVAGSGIRVSLFGVSPPELNTGDIVALEGKLGSTQGEMRIAISKPEGIAVITHGEPPTPHAITIGEIGDETEGWLVTTEGVVTQKLNDRFILDDGAGSVPVVPYEATHIDMAEISTGDAVRVTGIVSETNARFRLLPRSPEDVVVKSRAAGVAATGNDRPHISSLSIIAGLCASMLLGMVARKIINRQKPMVLKRPLVM